MVLTNFECWANSDNASGMDNVEAGGSRKQIDLFNPRSVQEQVLDSGISEVQDISCMSSNGYYGFAFINEMHSNNVENPSINNAICDKNMDALIQKRCRKRCHVDTDVLSSINKDNVSTGMYVEIVEQSPIGDKKCRIDEEFVTRNYKDTFPSCFGVMATRFTDLEECTEKYGQCQIRDPVSNSYNSQISENEQTNLAMMQRRQQFHGHLHRVNRDLSRCMLSHMI